MNYVRQAYISGAYTSSSVTGTMTNVQIAVQAGLRCAARGFFPIIPHTAIGHRGVKWSDAMELCLGLIDNMDEAHDVIVMLPEWQSSRGAVVEREHAKSRGIQVFTLSEITGGPDE
jgi:hypothetical protein